MESIFTHIPLASKYYMFVPVNVSFRDTMCYAPAGEKSLASLGKAIGVNKHWCLTSTSASASVTKKGIMAYYGFND